jgi:hypothetical protein
MCNPRRIRVTATRQIEEAWQREVSRSVQLQERVVGEARIRQPLETTIGRPALRSLESLLAANDSGWVEVEEGYRHEVEGGYVTYLIDEQALEIVATLEDIIQAAGEDTLIVEGTVQSEISAEGEGRYYDDNWGGHTMEVGRRVAQTQAEIELDAIARAQVEQAASEAERLVEAEVEAGARSQAEADLRRIASEREADLSAQARQRLDTVGTRCRQVFNRALAQAYRDAILAYAKRHGAENIQYSDNDNTVEIEFTLQQ